MPLDSETYTASPTVGTIVEMSADGQTALIQNQEPAPNANAMSRAGRVFLVHQKFDLASAGVALFNLATPVNGLQIEFYEIVSTIENVYAELVEGATVAVTGSAISAYNLNRQSAETFSSVFKAATSATGGSVVSAELVTASKSAGGAMQIDKIHTLAGSDDYVMRFTNLGNQTTTVFVQIAFAEKFNGHTEVSFGDTVGSGFKLQGGDSVKMEFVQNQSLVAVSAGTVSVGVLRQD